MSADIRLLGSLVVTGPNGPVAWTGARRKAIFALLALRQGRLVSSGSLADALWGADIPPTARKTLQSHVAQIRKALAAAGLGGVLGTRDPGYHLDVTPSDVDVHRFVQSARDGLAALDRADAGTAVERFETALRLWRGDPLADCPVTGWADAEIARLRETRALVEEHRAAALCMLGRHQEAIADLARLVADSPLCERLWALLISAQHRAGRSVDAVRGYHRVRDLLMAEHGLEPGPELRELASVVFR